MFTRGKGINNHIFKTENNVRYLTSMAATYIAQTIALDFEIICNINIKYNNDNHISVFLQHAFSYTLYIRGKW